MLRINCSKAVKLVAFVLPDFCAISLRNARGVRTHTGVPVRDTQGWPAQGALEISFAAAYYPSRVLESRRVNAAKASKYARVLAKRTLKKFICVRPRPRLYDKWNLRFSLFFLFFIFLFHRARCRRATPPLWKELTRSKVKEWRRCVSLCYLSREWITFKEKESENLKNIHHLTLDMFQQRGKYFLSSMNTCSGTTTW